MQHDSPWPRITDCKVNQRKWLIILAWEYCWLGPNFHTCLSFRRTMACWLCDANWAHASVDSNHRPIQSSKLVTWTFLVKSEQTCNWFWPISQHTLPNVPFLERWRQAEDAFVWFRHSSLVVQSFQSHIPTSRSCRDAKIPMWVSSSFKCIPSLQRTVLTLHSGYSCPTEKFAHVLTNAVTWLLVFM